MTPIALILLITALYFFAKNQQKKEVIKEIESQLSDENEPWNLSKRALIRTIKSIIQ